MMTKWILIRGLGPDVTETAVRSRLDSFGPVERVDIIREGSAANPSVLVEMSIGDKAAEYLTFRLSRIWDEDTAVSARLLNPGKAINHGGKTRACACLSDRPSGDLEEKPETHAFRRDLCTSFNRRRG